MEHQVRNVSIEPQQLSSLPEVTWEGISEAGTYVEKLTGALYRMPQEALLPGSSPVIRREAFGSVKLVQLSKNPFITTLQARMLACEHNVQPNF